MLAGAAVMTLAGAAQADNFSFDQDDFTSFGGTASFLTGTWDLTGSTLSLVLKNNNSLAVGGSITAIAFNIPVGVTLSGFTYFESGDYVGNEATEGFFPDGGVPPPGNIGDFNTVQTVADTGDGNASFGGDGNGMRGIEAQETGTFTWTVSSGSPTSVLEFLDFDLNHLPLDDGIPGQFAFALKFKGIGPNDDSDVMALIPLPAALPMGLAGLAGLALVRHRSKSAPGKKPATA